MIASKCVLFMLASPRSPRPGHAFYLTAGKLTAWIPRSVGRPKMHLRRSWVGEADEVRHRELAALCELRCPVGLDAQERQGVTIE
jgi:hypothetical protein